MFSGYPASTLSQTRYLHVFGAAVAIEPLICSRSCRRGRVDHLKGSRELRIEFRDGNTCLRITCFFRLDSTLKKGLFMSSPFAKLSPLLSYSRCSRGRTSTPPTRTFLMAVLLLSRRRSLGITTRANQPHVEGYSAGPRGLRPRDHLFDILS